MDLVQRTKIQHLNDGCGQRFVCESQPVFTLQKKKTSWSILLVLLLVCLAPLAAPANATSPTPVDEFAKPPISQTPQPSVAPSATAIPAATQADTRFSPSASPETGPHLSVKESEPPASVEPSDSEIGPRSKPHVHSLGSLRVAGS